MKPGLILFSLPALFALLAAPAAPALAAQLVMQNQTSDRLTLFVGKKQACTAAPGAECAADVSKGQVELRAVAPDGRTTYDRLDIREATMIWAVRYYQPSSSGPGEAPPKQ